MHIIWLKALFIFGVWVGGWWLASVRQKLRSGGSWISFGAVGRILAKQRYCDGLAIHIPCGCDNSKYPGSHGRTHQIVGHEQGLRRDCCAWRGELFWFMTAKPSRAASDHYYYIKPPTTHTKVAGGQQTSSSKSHLYSVPPPLDTIMILVNIVNIKSDTWLV